MATKLRVEGRFGVIPQSVLYSTALSLKAKGLYGYIQSKPDGWNFSADRICNETKDGRSSVQSALQELEDCGFLVRRKLKNGKGQWDWEHVLLENPSVENPPMENASLENRPTKKEGGSKKDIVRSTYTSKADALQVQSNECSQIIKAFEDVNPAVKRMYGNKTQRQACNDLIEQYGLEQVLRVIALLPQTNATKYMPTVTTPLQLRDKWVQLGSALLRYKDERTSKFTTARV